MFELQKSNVRLWWPDFGGGGNSDVYAKILNLNSAQLGVFSVGFMFTIFFDPEDAGDMFLRNNELSPNYLALQPMRPLCSY
jgi:hypothetical protein